MVIDFVKGKVGCRFYTIPTIVIALNRKLPSEPERKWCKVFWIIVLPSKKGFKKIAYIGSDPSHLE